MSADLCDITQHPHYLMARRPPQRQDSVIPRDQAERELLSLWGVMKHSAAGFVLNMEKRAVLSFLRQSALSEAVRQRSEIELKKLPAPSTWLWWPYSGGAA